MDRPGKSQAQPSQQGLRIGLLHLREEGEELTMRRVIGIGLDGASIELIEALLPSGALPNFARLREGSVRVPLRDELAYRHGMVWPQFVLGSEALSFHSLIAFS